MKKLTIILLITVMVLSFAACGGNGKSTVSDVLTESSGSVDASYATEDTDLSEDASVSTEATPSDLESRFKHYPNIVDGLGYFDSTDTLTAYAVFTWWMDFESTQPDKTESFWDDENCIDVFNHTYPVSELNEYTEKYLGRTWDYSTIVKTEEYDEAQYSYDPDSQAVVVTYMGALGGPSEDGGGSKTYEGYTAIDGTRYEITYSTQYMGRPVDAVIVVEAKGDNYVIVSHGLKN